MALPVYSPRTLLLANHSAKEDQLPEVSFQPASAEELAAEGLPQLMARLGIARVPPTSEYPRNLVFNGAPLGRARKIWGRALKMACRVHPRCTLMVEPAWFGDSALEAEKTVYRWVSQAHDCAENEHYLSSKKIAAAVSAKAKVAKQSVASSSR